MSGAELVIVWALFALALFAGPAYAFGWWNGRRCLRAVLDPRRLPPVEYDVRVVTVAPLRTAGRFPVDDPFDTTRLWLWSEQQAAIAANDREVRAMIADAEARIPKGWR